MNNGLFKQIYAYPTITNEELDQIKKAHEKVIFKKGDFLLKKKQVASEYYLLEEGLVRSFVHNTEGEDITTNFFCEGEIVIEVSSLFQRIPTQENIQALTDIVCWKIDYENFQTLFHTIDHFAEWGRAWLSSNLFYFKARTVDFITKSATERYLELISKNPAVGQQVSLRVIASYLGITDTSLSRIRKEIGKK